MTRNDWKANVRRRNLEILKFTVGIACSSTFLLSTALLLSWWVVTGATVKLGLIALGVGVGALLWTAIVTAVATPLLLRRFLWRKSLKVIAVLYGGVGVVTQLVVIVLAIVLTNFGPVLGISIFVIGLPLAPIVLPVLVIGVFRRDSWWEDPLACPSCGYDRRGLDPSVVCPECGGAPRAIIGP
ncbi:MAG: hypothetical protein JNK58_00650 [Phycisphaerae bacterium]|nr:hypothetical protein [Phycisphaerae bacterium]